MKAKAKTGEKTKAKAGEKAKAKAKAKKPAVKAAAPKAAKASKPKAAGRKMGMGAEIDKATAFFKSLTLKDLADLGEEGMRKLDRMFAAISAFGRKLRENAKTKNVKK